MTIDELTRALEALAQERNLGLRRFPDRPAVLCLELESTELGDGYLRLCVDADDGVAIVETAVPFGGVVDKDAPALDKLLALHFLAGPLGGGRRTYPSLDARNGHVVLSYVTGSAALRTERDIVAFAESCAAETAALMKTAGMLNSGNAHLCAGRRR